MDREVGQHWEKLLKKLRGLNGNLKDIPSNSQQWIELDQNWNLLKRSLVNRHQRKSF